jgi:hypothetical protein
MATMASLVPFIVLIARLPAPASSVQALEHATSAIRTMTIGAYAARTGFIAHTYEPVPADDVQINCPMTGVFVPLPGGITVNGTVPLVPLGVVIVTVSTAVDAMALIVKVTVTVVEFTTTMLLATTFTSDTVTAVAPVRFVPVRVADTIEPCTPWVGEIKVNVGVVGPVTVNVTVPVVPPGVVMLTVLAVRAAPDEITKFAVTEVELATAILFTVMPVPDTVMAVAPVRRVPVRVTPTVVPAVPLVGEIEESVGVGAVTVKVTVPVVPAGVVMLTVLAVRAALEGIVKVAVTLVELTTVRALTVMSPPYTFTAVAPVRFAPVSVTLTAVPATPLVGEIELSAGAELAALNATVEPLQVPAGEPLQCGLKVPAGFVLASMA